MRVDTTVVEADVKYPTDSGLLTAATCRIGSRLHRRMLVGVKINYVDRGPAARAHQHSIGAWLRRRTDAAKEEVLANPGLIADLADASVVEATVALSYQARRQRPQAQAAPSRAARSREGRDRWHDWRSGAIVAWVRVPDGLEDLGWGFEKDLLVRGAYIGIDLVRRARLDRVANGDGAADNHPGVHP